MRFLMPLLLLAACATAETPASQAIRVEATPIPLNPNDPAQQTVGRLRYMGGLVLHSDDKRFGGISGLRWISRRIGANGKSIRPVAQLLAITDAGNWIVLEPHESSSRLIGIAAATIGVLHGLDGRPLGAKAEADAEALTVLEDCHTLDDGCFAREVVVSFERDHRIWLYDLGGEAGPTGVPRDAEFARAWLKRQPLNGGIEAMASAFTSNFVLFSEDLRDSEGKVEGRELYCDECDSWPSTERAFTLDLPAPFQPTDSDWLEQDLLLLSRSYSPARGAAARIDIVDVARDKNGNASVSGTLTLVAKLRPPLSVDNMEGLAVRQEGDRTFLYIISDDNFSSLQRTLLLKFELLPESQ